MYRVRDDVLIRRVTGSPLGIEIRLDRGAEVRAGDEVAMGTGQGMLDQRFRALRLSYAGIELKKFGLGKAAP